MIREFAKPYIMLDKDGKIYNIEMHTSYEEANQFARNVYGDGAAADEYRYLVQIGDIKKDGIYYNVDETGDLTVAEYIPSDEEKINQLQTNNATLSDQLTEAQLALTEQYEANLALEDEVTNTQLALTELYEANQTTTTTKEA